MFASRLGNATGAQARGVALSAIMVASVIAMAFSGGAAGAPDSVGTAAGADNVGTAEIHDTLLEEAEDGPVTAVVRLDRADRTTVLGEDDVTAQLQSHAEQAQQPVLSFASEHDSVEVQNQLWLANAVLVETDADGLAGLAELPGVDRIHPNFELTVPDQPDTGEVEPDQDELTYGLEMINAPDVWDEFDTQGEGASVAVLDTGVDDSHPDLPELTDDQWAEWDDDGNPVDTDPNDGDGHGTHVSGTVVGSDDPDGDVPGFGVAPEATLYHGKVLSDTGGGTFTQVIAGMEWAVDDTDADIVSMSLGAPGFVDDMVEPSENARDAGVVLVASAGNSGAGSTGSPGNVFSNFASGAVDEDGDVASFSSGELIDTDSAWGGAAPDDWPEEYVVPNAAAPGVGVLSAVPGGGYDGTFSGTSMSAPHKAGTFALMVSFAPESEREELIEAMETTAEKPDDWDEPDDEPDIRYGHGIIDAHAAVSEVNPLTADSVLGDVTETGEVGLTDAILIQEEVAGVRGPGSSFFEPAADVNRDGDVSLTDAILVQEKVAGILDESEVEVSNLDAPPFVTGGTPIDVSADLENVGDTGSLDDIELRMAPADEPLDESAVLTQQFVDMAAPGVNTPVSNPAEMSMEFEDIPTDGLAGGEYRYGVFSKHHNQTDTITINAPFFEVTELDAPAEIPQDGTFSVEAEITNTGNVDETGDVAYQFPAAGEIIVEEDVPIAAGGSETVTFDSIEADARAGEYQHGVVTPHEERFTDITVLETNFEVTDLDAPAAVNVGDEITVSALVENVGGLADEQEISYELSDGISVAVVDETLSTEEIEGSLAERTNLSATERAQRAAEIQSAADLSEFLADELDDEAFDVVELNPENLLDNTHHDVYVINQFTEDNDASVFLDELGDSQATIHLDQVANDPTDENDGVVRLVLDVGDPEELTFSFGGSGADLHLGPSPHPLFDGVGEPGETVPLHTASAGDRGWHANYSGVNLADVSEAGSQPDGPAVAVNDDQNQILLPSSGRDSFTPHDTFSDAENALMLNAVEYAAFEQALAGDSLGGAGATGDSSETVQLDPGESTEVSFEYTVQAEDSSAVRHVVSSNDDFATGPVEIAAQEQVNVVDLDAPAAVEQGEQLAVTATLEHVGTETTTQNATYLFDGETEDTEQVSLEPGETSNVTLSTEIPVDQTPSTYEHGVTLAFDDAFAFVDVVEAGEPFFDIDGFDAPAEVDPDEEITVSAEVTNTGDLEGTQPVEYEFDVEIPGLTPLDVAVVDLDSDDSNNGGLLVDLLDDELDQEDSVTGYFEDDIADWQDAVVDDDHDVHLIHSVAADQSLMEHFLDNRGDQTTGVLLDSWDDSGTFTADAVRMLSDATLDPEFIGEHLDGSQNAYTNVEDSHPIFDGVAAEGESFFVKSTDNDEGAFLSMSEFGGQGIATGSFGSGGSAPAETTTVVDHDRGLVLDGMLGGDIFEIDQFSEDAQQVIVNAVEYAGSGALTPQTAGGATSEGVTTDDELQVAVVELAHTGGGSHGLDIEEILDDRLEDANIDLFFQDAIDGGEDAEAWETQLNEYDVHVVQAWGTHHSDHGTEHLEHFVENVDSSTAAVILDQFGDSSTLHSDGVEQYALETGDPGFVSGDIFDTSVGAWLQAEQDHPIFEGVIEEGEAAQIVNTDDDSGWFRTFSDTDAEIIGTGQFGEAGPTEGSTVAVDRVRQVVFNTMLGGTISDPLEKTDEAHDILANSVEFADDVLLGEGEQFLSLAPGESETVEFDVTVPDVEAGEYGHGIFSEDDSDTATVSVAQLDVYELSNLDPETAEVVVGEDGPIDVSVDVDNVGAEPGDQTVALEVTDDETGDVVYTDTVENVTLDPDEGETLSFADVPADALERGNYTHTVTTDDDTIAGSLSVFEEVFFEVSDLDAPAEAFDGETFDVSATVTNTVEETTVAVVDSEFDDDRAGALATFLDAEPTLDVDQVHSEDLLDVVFAYDVFVVNEFDDADTDTFLSQLGDAQGAIYLDQVESEADAVGSVVDARNDPEEFNSVIGSPDVELTITADHPLFDGIGDVDDTFVYLDPEVDTGWFGGYSGDVVGEIAHGGMDPEPAVGVSDEDNEILLASSGRTAFSTHDDFTDEEHALLLNAVEYAADEFATSSVSPEFTDTQTVEYVLNGTVERTEEVTLTAGESTTVSFEDIPTDLGPGTYEHGVETADDAATATIDIVEGAEYVLSNLDPETAEVGADEEFLDVSVDVENVGDTTQPLDIDLAVTADGGAGDLVYQDTATAVEIDPGEGETLTFADVPVGGLDPGEFEHQVSTPDDSISGTLTVLEPTFFNVTNLDAPDAVETAGSGDELTGQGTVNVSADVTNTLPPEPEAPVVSVVDSAFADAEAGALVDLLDAELDGEAIVQAVTPDELLTTTDSDVYVIQEFGDTDAGSFLDLLGDDQAVVALDQHGDGADAVESLAADVGAPGEFESAFAGGPETSLEITADHPLFDGVGDQGDVVTYHEGFDADRGWVEEYNGDSLGEIGAPADEIDDGGAAVGVNDDENQVLLPSSARTEFVIHDEFTAAEHTLLVNAVEHALDQAGVTVPDDGLDVDPDETGTQTVEYRIGNETLATQNVTLAAGETKTVTFDDIEVTVDPGEYEQGVYSADDSATASLTVLAADEESARDEQTLASPLVGH